MSLPKSKNKIPISFLYTSKLAPTFGKGCFIFKILSARKIFKTSAILEYLLVKK